MTDRILVIDDSLHNRMVAMGHLAAAKYRVDAVDSGEAGLAYLDAHPVDLVVLDVMMPGIDGFETCRRIRANTAIARTPVLFLTALGGGEATAPALEAGGDDLLPKPFDRSELILRVRALIRLRNQEKQLAAQNAQLRRLTAMIVHDLRGPASAILANNEMLMEAELPGDLREATEDISTAVHHLSRTISDLLDLSRAEDVGMEVRRETFLLDDLCLEIVGALRGFGRWKSVSIRPRIAARQICADRELVRRILQNLVHNAIRHSPPHTKVEIEARPSEGGVTIRVLDRGPGIAEDQRERIFDRYVSSGSHGLGLAFCRLAVEAHGGTIYAKPRDAGGSAFCFTLPQ